jgi:hypothetical protein
VPTPIASDRLAGRRFPWNRLSGKRSTPIRACLRSGAFGHEAKVDSLDGYPDISGIRALNSCRAHSPLGRVLPHYGSDVERPTRLECVPRSRVCRHQARFNLPGRRPIA